MTMPTSAPSFTTGSLLMLCFCISSAASLGGRIKVDDNERRRGHDLRNHHLCRILPSGKDLQKDLAGGDDAQALLEEPFSRHQHAALLLTRHSPYGLLYRGIRSHSGYGIAHQISDLHRYIGRRELNVYNGIPHLLIPVVTDPKKAAAALNWAVNEMTKRYKLFADYGVRNIDSYNELFNKGVIEAKATLYSNNSR